jgi:hypothetical protein
MNYSFVFRIDFMMKNLPLFILFLAAAFFAAIYNPGR